MRLLFLFVGCTTRHYVVKFVAVDLGRTGPCSNSSGSCCCCGGLFSCRVVVSLSSEFVSLGCLREPGDHCSLIVRNIVTLLI